MYAQYVDYLKGTKKSDNTIRAYCVKIKKMELYVGKKDEDITTKDLVEWRNSLSELSSNSVCLHIAAVKNYFRFLKIMGIVPVNVAEELDKPTVHAKVKEYVSNDDMKALINNARTKRDKAMIMLFLTTGMRFSELANITLEQYNQAKANNSGIKIVGKGNKERLVYLNPNVVKAIDEYLSDRNTTGRSVEPYLFLSFQGGQVADNNFGQTLKAIARKAGLPYAEQISPHWLRSACATMYIENGIPLNEVRDMLGHSNIAVTSRYIKSNQNNIRNNVMAMNF